MVKNDLIDRYIYAVTKHMKSAMKKDVAAELETIIQDMLEERCEDVTPTERDIKVVLTELGTPNDTGLFDWTAVLQFICVCIENCDSVHQWRNVTCPNYGSINIAYNLVYSYL